MCWRLTAADATLALPTLSAYRLATHMQASAGLNNPTFHGKRDAFYFDTEATIILSMTNNQSIHPHLTQHTFHLPINYRSHS